MARNAEVTQAGAVQQERPPGPTLPFEVHMDGVHVGTVVRNGAGFQYIKVPGARVSSAGRLFATLHAIKMALEGK